MEAAMDPATAGQAAARLSERQIEELRALLDITTRLGAFQGFDDLLRFIVGRVVDLLGVESASVLLVDEARGEFFFRDVADVQSATVSRLREIRFPKDRGISGDVLRTGEPAIVNDVESDPRFYRAVDTEAQFKTRSLLAVPLRVGDQIIGILNAVNKGQGQFDQGDLRLVQGLAGAVAVTIQNVRLIEELTAARAALQSENVQLRREMAGRYDFGGIVCQSAVMRRLLDLVGKLVDSSMAVLIQGETGTGRAIMARAIHYNGPRREKPFVSQSCGALSEALLESALFGHAAGALPGATTDKQGILEVANGGTIFLDDIEEMPPGVQAKLAGVLQHGEFQPVGLERMRRADVRVISATSRDLAEDVKAGRMREDLYYLLAVFPVRLPPLRERWEDIPLLAAHLVEEHSRRTKKPTSGLSREALAMLEVYPFPGNIRELENELERALILADPGGAIEPAHFSERMREWAGLTGQGAVASRRPWWRPFGKG
jgi:Nif-specific regulatory protein